MIPRVLGGSGLIGCFFCSAHRVSKWSLTPATSLWAKRKPVTSLTSTVMGSGCPHPLRFGRDLVTLLHNKARLMRMGVVGVTEHKPGVVCGQLRAGPVLIPNGQQAPGGRYPPTRLCLPGALAPNCRVALASLVLPLTPPFGHWGIPWVLPPGHLLNLVPSAHFNCPTLGQPSPPLPRNSGGASSLTSLPPPRQFIFNTAARGNLAKHKSIPVSSVLKLLFHLLIPFLTRWPPCCSSNIPAEILPQGLCACCSLCLEGSSPKFSHGSLLPLLQDSAQMSPPQQGLP